MARRIWAVIPAGGVGSRMDAKVPKQYMLIDAQPMLLRTLKRVCDIESVSKLVIGIAKEDAHWPRLSFSHPKLAEIVNAGASRVDTVLNCLLKIESLGAADDWALVHDAARPCVRQAEVSGLINTCLSENTGGILALPLSDTIKRAQAASRPSRIETTVSREHLWRAMTPQLFKVGELLSAIQSAKKSGANITDEASAMEAAGFQPLLVPCSPDNIKVTYPQDITFAEMILKTQTPCQ